MVISEELVGLTIRDAYGASVGRVEDVWPEGMSTYAVVRMGRFGALKLIPLRDAVVESGALWVRYEKATLKRAPKLDLRRFSREQEAETRAFFGLDDPAAAERLRPRGVPRVRSFRTA